jgi:hypothetical protein
MTQSQMVKLLKGFAVLWSVLNFLVIFIGPYLVYQQGELREELLGVWLTPSLWGVPEFIIIAIILSPTIGAYLVAKWLERQKQKPPQP